MILEKKDQVLRNRTLVLVKVLWQLHIEKEATWEGEDEMRELYPSLFVD